MFNVDSNGLNSNLQKKTGLCYKGLKLVSVPEIPANRAIFKIAGLLALAGLLTGCAALPKDASIESVNYRACLVTDGDALRPGLADSSVFSLNQAVVTFGIKKKIIESNPSKFETTIQDFVKSKCSFIAVVGSRFTQFVQPAVEANPATHFLFITDGSDQALLAANLENLAVYRVDVYEAGLLAGHLSASASTTHQLVVGCRGAVNAEYLDGLRAGASSFDAEAKTSTSVNSSSALLVDPDVLLVYGCRDEIPSDPENLKQFKLVGYGRDLFFDPALEIAKPNVLATIIPQAGPRFFEAIAADLESEFIGGTLGSTVASYGNGGLIISEEHLIALPTGELEKLKGLAEEYEMTFK